MGNLDTAIDLFDPDGYLEAQGWQTGSGGDVLEHQLEKTGSYTIWIKDYGLYDTGIYNLTFLKVPSPGDPGGGSIAAIVHSTVATTFDVRWNGRHFPYSLPAGGTVTFKVGCQ